MVRSYRDLVVWQKGMEIVLFLYEITRAFPREEVYGLTTQLRRAAVSVPSNIAAGHGHGTARDFRRMLERAAGTLMEIETQVLIAEGLGYVEAAQSSDALQRTGELGRMIRGLLNSLPVA